MFRISCVSALACLAFSSFAQPAPEAAPRCAPITAGEPGDRIVGGNLAPIEEWPAFASISIRPTNPDTADIHMCGATVISPDWLITAAHCVSGAVKEVHKTGKGETIERSLRLRHIMGGISGHIYATLNTDDLSEREGSAIIPIEDVIIHPEYNPYAVRENDIALLKLSRKWNGTIGRMGLSRFHSQLGGRAYVAGFGFVMDARDRDHTDNVVFGGLERLRRADGSSYLAGSKLLRAATVPPVSDESCRLSNAGNIDQATEFCAGFKSGSRDSCNTDSGGPIVQIDAAGCPYLVGIVQSGQWCGAQQGRNATYGVYTRLSAYSQFIDEHVDAFQLPLAPPETDHQTMLVAAEKIEKWGEPIPDRLNVTMHRVPRPGVGDAELDPRENSFIDGDGMYIEFASRTHGDLAIIDMNARGELLQIYSTNIDALVSAEGEETRPRVNFTGRLPSSGESFPAGKPHGEGRLLVVVSPTWAGLDFSERALAGAEDPSSQILDNLATAVSDERNTEDYAGWAIFLTPYRIAPRNFEAEN